MLQTKVECASQLGFGLGHLAESCENMTQIVADPGRVDAVGSPESDQRGGFPEKGECLRKIALPVSDLGKHVLEYGPIGVVRTQCRAQEFLGPQEQLLRLDEVATGERDTAKSGERVADALAPRSPLPKGECAKAQLFGTLELAAVERNLPQVEERSGTEGERLCPLESARERESLCTMLLSFGQIVALALEHAETLDGLGDLETVFIDLPMDGEGLPLQTRGPSESSPR